MKKIFFILTLFITAFVNYSAQTEKLDQFFDSFENKNGVTSINIKKPMFDLLDRIDISNEYIGKIKPLMRDVNGLKLLVFSKITFPDELKSENQGQIKMNQEKSKRVAKLLTDLKLNELMSIKNDDVSMKFLAENAKDGVLENLIFNVDSKDEIAIFILNGKMRMDDVNNIINSTEIKTTSATQSLRSSFNSENTSSYLNGENRNVGEFSKIDVSMGINVNYKQENTTSIKVLADADKLQYVITKNENGVLKIYIDNKGIRNLRFKNLTVNVSSPKMNSVETSSGASFTAVNTVRENNLNVNASSGSTIKGKFDADIANFDVNSGSNVKADLTAQKLVLKNSSGASSAFEGVAKTAIIDLSSGASCKANGFIINTAEAEATSGASLSLYVKDKLKVRASSGGSVRLKGNPEVDSKIDKVSGGSLSKIN
ncbi:DUF4252 domain-containing protein [Chryseobacterium echinoideorum]|uniref:DUF4252 domain-containing protein n=1 Tax=Chryseobacterium echinoideorum TaxID=1549648 RepID=UPI001184A435|nr:DUF4252 domain-containing protein [Chryseobacterium echinoideorum]